MRIQKTMRTSEHAKFIRVQWKSSNYLGVYSN